MENFTLVFVDDNVELGTMMEMQLSSTFNVVSFSEPQKALNYIEENRDDIKILLTDFLMPEMNGVDLIRAVKRVNPHMLTVILTGYMNDFNELDNLGLCNMVLDKSMLSDPEAFIEKLVSL